MKKPVIAGIPLIILLVVFLLSAGCSYTPTETPLPSSVITPLPSSVIIPTPPATPLSITLATDKTQYNRDEPVKLKVTNNLDIPIWYIGYTQRDMVFWEIEQAQSNGWEGLNFRLPILEGGKEVCRIILYEQPVGTVTELKPHSDLLYEWNQKICSPETVTEPSDPVMIERGRYRFAFRYSLDTVKAEDIKTEPWKRPIDLGETQIVYSNEFILE